MTWFVWKMPMAVRERQRHDEISDFRSRVADCRNLSRPSPTQPEIQKPKSEIVPPRSGLTDHRDGSRRPSQSHDADPDAHAEAAIDRRLSPAGRYPHPLRRTRT